MRINADQSGSITFMGPGFGSTGFLVSHFFPPYDLRPMQSNRDLIVDGIGFFPDTLPKPIVWHEFFGNNNPVELEIGMGKGTFLTDQACSRPDTNFFGIEYVSKYWRHASDRLRRHRCTNARTVRAEAMFILREWIPDASLSVLHVYFPDPWPKKRHHKRRLVQAPFLELAERLLVPGGRLQVVTDHKGYFEEHIEPAIGGSKLQVVDYNRPGSANEGEFVGTNFERKYRREGRPFYALAAVKSLTPPLVGQVLSDSRAAGAPKA
jgi:tRNA (guanine-N7-)-methyltransferase